MIFITYVIVYSQRIAIFVLVKMSNAELTYKIVLIQFICNIALEKN